MFIQKEKQISDVEKVYIKGSGTSGCLLTGRLDDEGEFIELGIKNMEIIDIQLSGLFAIGLARQLTQKSFSTKTQVFRWGNFNNKIILSPQIIRLVIKSQVTKVSCGWNHALFMTSQGKILGTGENKYGQLGLHNSNKFYETIVEVIDNKFMESMSVIGAGFRQSYWSNSQSQVFGCGESKNNELGLMKKKQLIAGTKIDFQKKIMITENKNKVKKIICGKKFMVLLNQSKQVYAVGSNDFNCLLVDEKTNYVQKLTKIKQDVTDIQCGWSHIVFMDINGRIITRGRNNFGQLGRNANQQFVQIGQKCSLIKSGTEFSLALGQSGNLYGWGWNQHMNIVNQKQSEIISKPKLIKQPQNFKIVDLVTYPAITIIRGVESKERNDLENEPLYL